MPHIESLKISRGWAYNPWLWISEGGEFSKPIMIG